VPLSSFITLRHKQWRVKGEWFMNLVLPSKEQLIWANLEIGVIIHIDVQVFENNYEFREQWGHQPAAEVFAPMQLDTDQWMQTAKTAGAKYAVLVAKHCSGFCLWPTNVHDYSVKNSPWKNGRGDIVGDFFKSCVKYDIKPGLYYSASCNAYCDVDNPGIIQSSENNAEKQQKYNEMVLAQLTELWTRYGDIFEIWFDGGCLPPEDGGPDIAGLLHKLQPNAIVFQGPPGTKSLIRWVGNERGVAPEDCFSTVDFTPESFNGHDERIYGGNPDGATWSPAESDIPNRYAKKTKHGGWFWYPGEDDMVIPADELFEVYLKSVGRNTNLLIGMVPDNRGLIPEADAATFAAFGEKVREAFAKPLAEADIANASDKYNYRLAVPEGAKYLVLKEDISKGERVLGYSVNGSITGKCIGHKKIINLPSGLSEITLAITEAKIEPALRSIQIF